MTPDIQRYLAVLCASFVVTFFATPYVKKLAFRVGAVDRPNARRPHARPTPRGGGLAVILGVHAACLIALIPGIFEPALRIDIGWWVHFVVATLVLVVAGGIDDTRGLRASIKLVAQGVAAAIMVHSGISFGHLFYWELPPITDSLLSILWIVGVINAFNLIDGLDGLASGLAVISALGLGGMMILGTVRPELVVLVALVGACLAFLKYNFHPASIFLGDTGSMFVGFVLGVISLMTMAKQTFVLSLAIPLLVLGVPIFDEFLAIWRRSVRAWLRWQQARTSGAGGGLFQPDLEHLHHRLLKAGLSTRRGAVLLWALNAVLVAVGLLLTSFRSHAAGIFLIALLAGAYLIFRNLAAIELRDTGRMILTGLRRPTRANFMAMASPLWDMATLAGALALGIWILEGWKPGFWHGWYLELPIWVTPTFTLIAASRVYDTIWNRARLLDILMLGSTLCAGLAISLSIAMLIDPSNPKPALLRALFVGAVGHPAIIGVRILYRATEELVLYLRNRSELRSERGKVLLYGAGGHCQLFLKERGYVNSSSFDGGIIVGLIDDDPALHGRWVYAYQVLGGGRQLPSLIDHYQITRIVITTNLLPENLRNLKQVALEHPVELREWTFGERPVVPDAEHGRETVFTAEVEPKRRGVPKEASPMPALHPRPGIGSSPAS